jgi:glutamate carboxypeptidase
MIESTTLAAGIAEWIRCESPSSSPSSIAKMVAMVEQYANSLGLFTTVVDVGDKTGPLLHVSNRATDDTREGLLILGHLDTVHPIGTLEQNPCRIENDRLYGPGGYDMKAGAYLAVTALGRVSRQGSTALPVDILLVPDEEVGTHHSRATIERFAKNARLTLVGEPARADAGKCVTARKGTGMARVHVHGRPAHAGVDHAKGRSAIREMAHQILAFEALTDYARGVTVNVGTVKGGTVTNTVPQHCEAMVDFRVPDMDAALDVLAQMRALKAVGPDVQVDIDVELNRPPMVRTEAIAHLLERAQVFASQSGFTLNEAPPTGGGSDGNFTAAMGVPTLDGLGAEGDGAHTLNEYVRVSTLSKRLDFWERLVGQLD